MRVQACSPARSPVRNLVAETKASLRRDQKIKIGNVGSCSAVVTVPHDQGH
jgi:hypothetical protein